MALVGDCRLSGEGEWSGKGRISGRWFRWFWGFGGWGRIRGMGLLEGGLFGNATDFYGGS